MGLLSEELWQEGKQKLLKIQAEGRGGTPQTRCPRMDPHRTEGHIVPFAGSILGVRWKLGGKSLHSDRRVYARHFCWWESSGSSPKNQLLFPIRLLPEQ